MKRIRIIGMCLVAVFAFSAIAAASAYAEPEIVLKAGKSFPLKFSGKNNTENAELTTAVASPIICKLTLFLGVYTSAMLGEVHFVFHKCTTEIGGSTVNCQTKGDQAGLILTPLYIFHIGKLVTLGSPAKKDVLILILVTNTEFECGGNNIPTVGNLVGVFPERNKAGEEQFNKFRTNEEIEFKQASAGKQELTTFEFTLPAETKTGLHLEATLPLFGKQEAAEVAKGVGTLEPAGETVELKG